MGNREAIARADPPLAPLLGSTYLRSRQASNRYPPFLVEESATGTITEATEWLIALRTDEHVPGAEDWDK